MLRLFERIFHFEIRINSIEADEEFYLTFESIENEAIFTAPCRRYLDFAIKYGFIDESGFIKYERTQMRYIYRRTKREEFKKYARDEALINESFAREMAEDLPPEPFNERHYCMKEWENKNCVLAAVTNRIEQKADEKIQEIIDKPKKKNK
jgi:FMN phosphatase YigB (HAD superfamily)